MTRQLEQYLQTISEDPRASIKLFALGDDFDEKYVDGEDEPSGDVLGPHIETSQGWFSMERYRR
jgi:hypothetical protein